MAERAQPSIYTILPHRGFADALATGLVARYRNRADGLASLTLLLTNQRARRTMIDAFVRHSDGGLLLPKMVVIGDVELAESVGASLDPLSDDIPAAMDPLHRQFVLSRLIRDYQTQQKQVISLAESFRLAREFGAMLDQLAVEELDHKALDRLTEEYSADLPAHWQDRLSMAGHIAAQWQDYLGQNNRLDAAARRNLLFTQASKAIRDNPKGDIIAAGITTPAPTVARLLRAIAFAEGGSVILPGLDLNLDEDIWQGLMPKAADDDPGEDEDNSAHQINHPQYHLRLLLERMSIRRDEVRNWHRSGEAAAPPVISHTISNIFLPARHSGQWRDLKSEHRRLSNVWLIECDTLGEEAQTIALLVRKALETPEKRVAVVTPDRVLARRVAKHLARWNIVADDSAGRPLGETLPGGLFLSVAECLASRFSPVALLDMLKHPLVRGDRLRGEWLGDVRALDLALRGPRTGLRAEAITRQITRHFADQRRSDSDAADRVLAFWQALQADYLAPLMVLADGEQPLSAWLAALRDCASRLTQSTIWQGQAGRALADCLSELEGQAEQAHLHCAGDELPVLLRGFFADQAIRPGYGQHPRVAILGLLEARLQRADLMICAGLNAGKWPGQPSPDPFVPPVLRRKLNMPTTEYSNGLSAHDLAAALGAPECVLTRAARDSDGITIASPFLRRLQAMLGDKLQRDTETLALARALDRQLPPERISTPAPKPSATRRQVTLAATDLDRLRGAQFAFYAGKILRLRSIESPDAKPTAAWRGTAVHAILEDWVKQDNADPALLDARLERFWQEQMDFPVLRAVWRPRIDAAMQWIADETERLRGEGRTVLAAEATGRIDYHGITLKGTADRIDRSADNGLIIIDYKTGQPPTAKQVETGYAMQLGVLSLIAECGGFEGIKGEVETVEYWSLARDSRTKTFGYRKQPLKVGRAKSGLEPDQFKQEMVYYLDDALNRWIFGEEPFTAEPDPDYPGYNDYDDLSRLEEWYGRSQEGER